MNDGLRPALTTRRLTPRQRLELELLELLASNAAGETPEPELERIVDRDDALALRVFSRSFLESMSHTRWVRTTYRGIIGSGYVAWSITDDGRRYSTELRALGPGARR